MNSKRKATVVASLDPAETSSKRRRVPDDDFPLVETPEWVAKQGLEFLDKEFKETKDKYGRAVIPPFLTLPDKEHFPQYYDQILLPIAVDTIEAKLRRHEYPSMSAVESDLKRLVSNAKAFNEKTSLIYSDAERLRKTITHKMPIYNPAYKRNPNYVAVATPIPIRARNLEDGGSFDTYDDDVSSGTPSRDPRSSSTPVHHVSLKLVSSRKNTAEGIKSRVASSDSGFAGDSFQTVQEKIVDEMMQLEDSTGRELSLEFQSMPSKKIRGYYELIKHPMSLKEMKKKVLGGSMGGKSKPSGVTELKSWQAFEDEMSYIWKNAREFNIETSEIVEKVGKLETYFYKRLAEAKPIIQEPSGIKLRITNVKPSPEPPQPVQQQQKLMLRFGGRPSSAATSTPSNTEIKVDQESLKRQQELVKAGANGQVVQLSQSNQQTDTKGNASPRSSTSASITPAPGGPVPVMQHLPQGRQPSVTDAPSPMSNGVKIDKPPIQSPSLGNVQKREHSQTSQEAPQTPIIVTETITKAMPPPPSSINSGLSNSPLPSTPIPRHSLHNQQVSAFERRFRLPGQNASNALITNVLIRTHPGLRTQPKFYYNVPADPTKTQYSVTLTLPHNQYYLQMIPSITAKFGQRMSKVFVTLTTESTPRRHLEAMTHYQLRNDNPLINKPVYDFRIEPGINKIEVETVVGPMRGIPRTGAPADDLEMERVTLLVNKVKGPNGELQ